jgi:hypothetical protein
VSSNVINTFFRNIVNLKDHCTKFVPTVTTISGGCLSVVTQLFLWECMRNIFNIV